MSKFYYQIKGSLYRSANNPYDLIEINEIFKNDIPIVARKRAFDVYQNYIDVLLQSKNLVHEDHRRTVFALKDFINFKTDNIPLYIRGILKPSHVDWDTGMGIYLIMSDSKTFSTLEGEIIYENKILIHDLNSKIEGLKEVMHTGLLKEYDLYKKYDYDCKNYVVSFPTGEESAKTKFESILKTPIDYAMMHMLKII